MKCALCDRRVIARGYCTLHYQRWKKWGDPNFTEVAPRGTPVPDRLSRYSRRARSGCLEWTGARNGSGYGKIQIDGRTEIVSRIAWELSNGAIPDGIQVCHSCDNPPCFEVSHLFLGTGSDNMRDCVRKGRKYIVCGEAHHLTTLSADDVREIRSATTDLSYQQLARQFNVSGSTIRRIVTGETWAHLAS